MSITTRIGKGAPLTFTEMDNNFLTLAGLINAGFNYALDTGAVNALAITLTAPPASYVDGMNFSTKVLNTNTGPATLNVNGFGPKNIYDEYNTLLPANILRAGQIYTFVYNSSLNSGVGGFNAYIANVATSPIATTLNNPGTTVGQQLINLGSATGATNVGYTNPSVGGVATTVSNKFKQYVSVIDFGADPTGVVDSTTAIQNATKSDTLVFFPFGNYKITNLVLTNIVNCTWLGAAVGGVTITTAATGVMITWNNCGFNVIDGFIFNPTGTLASSTGMLFQSASNNNEVRHCLFQLWTKIGLQHLGTVGTPLTGNKLYDSFLLQNANASGFGQLDMAYSNDFFVGNNQLGIINTGTYGFPSFGIRANNTSNGGYINNFVWQNLQGLQLTTCAYDRIISNRFEQSQHEGAIINGGTAMMFQNNWINNNGQATLNTYNQLRIQGCTNSLIHGNNFWDWSLGTNSAKYSMSYENSSTRLSIKNNVCDKYGTAATFFDSTMPSTTNTTDGSLSCNSGANTVAAGATVFLGQGYTTAATGTTQQYLPSSHTIVQLVVEAGAAPGASQTFVYTLYKNGIATALTVTLSGASAVQGASSATTVIEDVSNSSAYTVQVVTSAGATVTSHWAQVVFVNR